MSLDKRKIAFLEMWKKERSKGKGRYIILNSMIVFTLLFLVSMAINYSHLAEGDFSYVFDLRRVGLYSVVSVVIVMMRWRRNERLYNTFGKDLE